MQSGLVNSFWMGAYAKLIICGRVIQGWPSELTLGQTNGYWIRNDWSNDEICWLVREPHTNYVGLPHTNNEFEWLVIRRRNQVSWWDPCPNKVHPRSNQIFCSPTMELNTFQDSQSLGNLKMWLRTWSAAFVFSLWNMSVMRTVCNIYVSH